MEGDESMKVVILAAGIGKRLYPFTKKKPKSLIKINGKSIFERIIDTCLENYLDDFIVVTGYHSEMIITEGEKFKKTKKISIQFINNPLFNNTNTSYSLSLGISDVTESFIIINGDNIFESMILTNLLNNKRTSIVIDNIKIIDEESFKVILIDNKIVEIGKNLKISEASGEFIGISLIKSEDLILFKAMLKKIISKNPNEYYDIVFKELNLIKDIGISFTNGLQWTEIDFIKDIHKAYEIALNIDRKIIP